MIKYQNINIEDWDNLIILDACRFDFFNKVYKDYLAGKLEKRISKGSNTGEWLVKTFPNKYDYIYVSANPYINSLGFPLNLGPIEYRKYNWTANKHFLKIIDVWKFGWVEKYNTIHPKYINMAYLSNKDDKKTIIHYMQPHYPYINYKGVLETRYKVELMNKGYFKFIVENIFQERFRLLILQKFLKLFKRRYQLSQLQRVYIEVGMDKLQYYYEDNLRIVLKYVSELIEELEGKTIITADHGDAFGEKGIWGHPPETHIPVLIEVPWLEVKS